MASFFSNFYDIQRAIVVLLFLFLFGFIFNFVSDLIPPFLIAFFLSYLLNPIVDRLEYVFKKRLLALSILYVVLITAFVFFFNIITPLLGQEFNELTTRLPYYLTAIKEYYMFLKLQIESSVPLLKQTGILETFQVNIQGQLISFAQFIPTLFLSTFSTLSYSLLIPIILFFMLNQGPEMKMSFFKLIPNKYFELSMHLFYQIGQKLGNYLRGICIETLIIGLLATIVMFYLGVDYSILLGTIAGITNVIPYLGPLLGALPAILIYYVQVQSIDMVVYLIIGFVVIQLVDNFILKPIIYSHSVDLHPVAILFFLLLGGSVGGVWGLIFAVPIAGIFKVVYTSLSKEIMFRYRLRVEKQ